HEAQPDAQLGQLAGGSALPWSGGGDPVKSATHVTGPLIKLTIFAVITVVTTAVLGISIANINMSGTVTYTARFSDATLLLENDDVRIAGVRVGQVTDVHTGDPDVV